MSKTINLAKEIEFQTLKILSKNGGELSKVRLKEILKEELELDDWAKEVYDKTGYTRWESILQFFSIDLKNAGFITKKNSSWSITDEGENALKWGKDKLFEEAQKRCKTSRTSYQYRYRHQQALRVAQCLRNMYAICKTRCVNCGDPYGLTCPGCTFGAGVGILEWLEEKLKQIDPDAFKDIHAPYDVPTHFEKNEFTTLTTNLALSAAATEIYLYLKQHNIDLDDNFEFKAYFHPFIKEMFNEPSDKKE